MKKIKLNLPDIVILIALLNTLLYIVANNLPPGLGSFRFLWGPAAIGIIVVTKPTIIFRSPMKYTLIYVVLVVGILQYTLWQYMTPWNINGIQKDAYILIISTLIWSYYSYKQDFVRLSYLSRWAFLFILITIVTTNIALAIDPLIVRNSATGYLGNAVQIRLARLTGAAGYGYAQALVIFIPLLVYHIKTRRKLIFSRNNLIIILVLIIITILRAQVFANVLVMLVILMLSFASSKRRRTMYKIVAMFVLLFLIIPSTFYANLFRTASNYFPVESNTYYKLNDFAIFIEYPELDPSTQTGGRAERYPILFEAFADNLFLGNSSYKSPYRVGAGGHLYWMNRLTNWGILGFSLFIFTLYKIYQSISSRISDEGMRFYYFLSVITFIVFGLLKNISGREPWIFLIVVIPGLYLGTLAEIKNEIDTSKNRG